MAACYTPETPHCRSCLATKHADLFLMPKPYHIKAPFNPSLLFPHTSIGSPAAAPLATSLLLFARLARKASFTPTKNPPTPAATTQPHLLETTTLHSAPQDREYLLTANVSKTKTKKKKKKKASGLTQSRSRKQYPFGTKVPSLQQHASMPEISPLRKSLALRGRGGGGVRWRRRGHFLALWPSGSFGFFGVPRSLVIFLQVGTYSVCIRSACIQRASRYLLSTLLMTHKAKRVSSQNTFMPCLRLGSFLSR